MNQCDGCRAGMMLKNGLHVDEKSSPVMVCQKTKYPEPPKPDLTPAPEYTDD